MSVLHFNFQALIEGFTKADYKEVVLAFVVALIIGYIISRLSLPIPAPPVLAGIMGIFGIWVGFLIGK